MQWSDTEMSHLSILQTTHGITMTELAMKIYLVIKNGMILK